MLGQRHRRWLNIKTTLGQYLVCGDTYYVFDITTLCKHSAQIQIHECTAADSHLD